VKLKLLVTSATKVGQVERGILVSKENFDVVQ